MPHKVNIESFRSGSSSDKPLPTLYCLLVGLELVLKDHLRQRSPDGEWIKGHDIPYMLNELSDSGLTAYSMALRTTLSKIPCTAVDGSSTIVESKKYPDIRYMHHKMDFSDGIDDSILNQAIDLVNQIYELLQQKGIRI